jgi:hypothetical protein
MCNPENHLAEANETMEQIDSLFKQLQSLNPKSKSILKDILVDNARNIGNNDYKAFLTCLWGNIH